MANQASFCHVFLSFRGETRNKFTCFLHDALKAAGFVAFMDKTDIHVGDEVHSTIKEGIKSSMSSIIVFSQNYAYSTWCLDELVLILERLNSSRYFIIPILYEVEHKDIKHQLGNYGLALEKHRARHSDKIDKWRQALVQVGNILGDRVEGSQNIFIQNTVKLLREKFAAKFPEYPLPSPKDLVNPSSSRQPPNDMVILYTTSMNNGLGANNLENILLNGNVVYEKRNCTKEPKYLKELEELVSKDKVRFPMVIVNGKDLCGEEEVDGNLDDFLKQNLIQVLRTLYTASAKSIEDITRTISLNDSITQNGIFGNIFPELSVRITNTLSNTLVAHVQSKDNNFGEKQLNKDQSMEWYFRRIPIPEITLFWCNFQDGSRSKGITVYDEHRYGLLPIYKPFFSKFIYWEVREDGFYFNHYPNPNPPTPWVKKHDW